MAAHRCSNCGQFIEYWPGPASIVLSCPRCSHSVVLRRVPPKTSTPRPGAPFPGYGAEVRKQPARDPSGGAKPWQPRNATPVGKSRANGPGNDSGSFWQTAGGSLIGVAGLVAALVIAGQFRGGRAAKPAQRQTTEVTAERATASSMRSERSPSAADQVTPTEYDSLTPETGPAEGSYGAVVDRDLAIPENAPLVAWLNTPRPALGPVTPRWLPLPFARWEDHSNRVYQENGIDYQSDREPLRFNVNLKVDHALADAIERQFGRPQDAQQPASSSYLEGGTRKPLDLVLDQKAKEIQSAHGYRVDDQVMRPDYEWLIDTSASTCAIVAPAVVAAYTGKPVAATTARERLEALRGPRA